MGQGNKRKRRGGGRFIENHCSATNLDVDVGDREGGHLGV